MANYQGLNCIVGEITTMVSNIRFHRSAAAAEISGPHF